MWLSLRTINTSKQPLISKNVSNYFQVANHYSFIDAISDIKHSNCFPLERIDFSAIQWQRTPICSKLWGHFPQSKVVINFVNCTSLEFCSTMPGFCIALFGPFIANRINRRTLTGIFSFQNIIGKLCEQILIFKDTRNKVKMKSFICLKKLPLIIKFKKCN